MSFQTDSLTPELPWSSNPRDAQRFRRILALLLIVLLLAMIIIPLVQVPELKRESIEKVPQQVARFIVEHQTIAPPKLPSPPAPVKPKELDQKKTPTKARAKKQHKSKQLSAKEVAQKHISSFSSSLAQISALPAVPKTLKIVTSSNPQSTPDIASGSLNTGKMSTRIHAGSSTLTIAKASNMGTPQALSSTPLQRASTNLGPDRQGMAAKNSAAAKKDKRDKRIRRSRENIQKIFDSNKGAIYAIYNRALRSNPDLEGKVVFNLVISPNGKVTQCEIGSSNLSAPKLERKLVARIKLFEFGAIENVEVWRDSFYLDFIPAP